MKKRLRLAGKILFSLPFFWWLYTKLFWPSTILDAPEIAANFYSKEMCSCVFVVGQTEELCLKDTKQWVPASTIKVDREKKHVNVRVFWALSQSKFLGERDGCRIELRPVD